MMVGKRKQEKKSHFEHFTHNIWDHDERAEPMEKLSDDKLLATILRKIQIIVNDNIIQK